MKLSDLTWQEAGDYLTTNTSLLIPAGTCEQHGPHLPLSTDTDVTEQVALDVSRQTGILVAPTINYGVNLPTDHAFYGTNSTTEENLKELARNMLEWWRQQGFTKFYFLSAHGDPFHIKALSEAGESTEVIELYDFEMADLLNRQEFTRHADEAETSVMMHLFPDKVRRDKIEDFWTEPKEFMDYFFHKKHETIDGSNGVQGFPSAASAEKGKLLYERMLQNVLSKTSA